MSVQVTLVLKHNSDFLSFYPSEAKIPRLRKKSIFIRLICLGLSMYVWGRILRVEIFIIVQNLVEWEFNQTIRKISLGVKASSKP